MTGLRATVLVVLQILFVFVLGFLVVAPRFLPDPENRFAPSWQFYVLIVVFVTFGAVALVWQGSVRAWGSWRALGWHFDGGPLLVAKGLLGAAVAVGVTFTLRALVGAPFSDSIAEITALSVPEHLVFLTIGVQAAFIEESLFRGNVQPLLERRLGFAGALALTAVLFSLYHLQPRPLALVGKTFMGLIYGALRGKGEGRSLVPGAIAHALTWAMVGGL